MDGVLYGKTVLDATRKISVIDPTLAYLVKSGNTANVTWRGSIHKFSIYNKALAIGNVQYLYKNGAEPITGLTVSTNFLPLDDITTNGTFTVSGSNLANPITLTAPAGITLSTYSIPANSTEVLVQVTYDGLTNVAGYIKLQSGSKTFLIRIKASKNTDCFIPLYPGISNQIVDPTCNSFTADGWGNKSINTDTSFVYCGSRSAKIAGGSYDRKLTGIMKPNTLYRLKAKVWKVSGNVGVGVFGWNNTAASIYQPVTTVDSWQDIDFSFTTGPVLNPAGQVIYFSDGTGYIDNWEMYEVPVIIHSPSSLAYQGSGTQKVLVTGVSLTNNISVTAPAGFSVSSASLPLNAAEYSLSITFDGVASSSGYVYLTSGSVKDSVYVNGIAQPEIRTNPSSLLFDEVKTSSSFTVSGQHLTNDITLAAPTGITLSRNTGWKCQQY